MFLMLIQKSAAKLHRYQFRNRQPKPFHCRFRNRHPKTMLMPIKKSVARNCVTADLEIGSGG